MLFNLKHTANQSLFQTIKLNESFSSFFKVFILVFLQEKKLYSMIWSMNFLEIAKKKKQKEITNKNRENFLPSSIV